MADFRESEHIFERLAASELLTQFRYAFEAATGLPLELHEPESDFGPGKSVKANSFCRILNEHNRCPDCTAAAHCMVKENSAKPRSIACFAGMTESAIPILAGVVPVAFLTTGQVFTRPTPAGDWIEVSRRLAETGVAPGQIERLETAWHQTREISKDQYEGIVTLLAVFAGQLSDLADKILLTQQHSEPAAVTKARQYVNARLSERIELADVAGYVNMSLFHFCKVFKQATGLTFKQYLTRRRVEWAKCCLRKPDVRVTEVAYDVGFGSLSQFNRSFMQQAGLSPTEWRARERAKLA